ncbi:MAG: hypothetical protein KJO50_06075, partial [Bacteroidia bacterium]|nr:hypothetical protein [Bacteroidia bacterium]
FELCVTSVIIFLSLRILNVRIALSVLFAILIVLLSPQVTRFCSGHYSTAHTLLIPLLIYLTLLIESGRKFILVWFFCLISLIFFGLNDIYLFGLGGFFIVSYIIFRISTALVAKAPIDWNKLSWIFLLLFTSLVVIAIFIKGLDPVHDRVSYPAGYFTNLATIHGIFMPQNTLLWPVVHHVFGLNPASYESVSYVGITGLFFFLFCLYYFIQNIRTLYKSPEFCLYAIGLLALLYSLGIPAGWMKEWSYDILGPIMQFRAPGRFAWIFYYCLLIVSSLYLDRFYDKLKSLKGKNLARIILSFIILFWGIEVHQYLTSNLYQKTHPNPFRPTEMRHSSGQIMGLELSPENYQGILILPNLQGWTDKVRHEGHWASYYFGMKTSINTGIPLINGVYSRMSVSQSLECLQLLSHRAIPRKIFDKLDKRDILVIIGEDAEFHPNERWLLDQCILLRSLDRYSIYALDLDRHKTYLSQVRDSLRSTINSKHPGIVYNEFNLDHQQGMFDTNAKMLNKGTTHIIGYKIPDSLYSKTMELSLWTFVDHEKGGMPFYYLDHFKNEELVETDTKWSIEAYDTQESWVRTSFEIRDTIEFDSISLKGEHFHPYIIDNLLIREKKNDFYRSENGIINYNNYFLNE